MADIKISALSANVSPASTDVVPVSNAAGTATNKVTLQAIADLAVGSNGTAVQSDDSAVSNSVAVTNIVKITQANYDLLSSYSDTTVYIIEG